MKDIKNAKFLESIMRKDQILTDKVMQITRLYDLLANIGWRTFNQIINEDDTDAFLTSSGFLNY